MIVFLKANVSGYTRKDGVVVRPHTDRRPPAQHGEWEDRGDRGGMRTYRRLRRDEKPAFRGSGRRYDQIHVFPDGTVQAESHHGHITVHRSIEEAKARLDGG